MIARYFIGRDQSSHAYYVPWVKRAEWIAWSDLDDDDERSWDVPEYAVRIDGGTLTFENPRIELRRC